MSPRCVHAHIEGLIETEAEPACEKIEMCRRDAQVEKNKPEGGKFSERFGGKIAVPVAFDPGAKALPGEAEHFGVGVRREKMAIGICPAEGIEVPA